MKDDEVPITQSVPGALFEINGNAENTFDKGEFRENETEHSANVDGVAADANEEHEINTSNNLSNDTDTDTITNDYINIEVVVEVVDEEEENDELATEEVYVPEPIGMFGQDQRSYSTEGQVDVNT